MSSNMITIELYNSSKDMSTGDSYTSFELPVHIARASVSIDGFLSSNETDTDMVFPGICPRPVADMFIEYCKTLVNPCEMYDSILFEEMKNDEHKSQKIYEYSKEMSEETRAFFKKHLYLKEDLPSKTTPEKRNLLLKALRFFKAADFFEFELMRHDIDMITVDMYYGLEDLTIKTLAEFLRPFVPKKVDMNGKIEVDEDGNTKFDLTVLDPEEKHKIDVDDFADDYDFHNYVSDNAPLFDKQQIEDLPAAEEQAAKYHQLEKDMEGVRCGVLIKATYNTIEDCRRAVAERNKRIQDEMSQLEKEKSNEKKPEKANE